MAEPKQTTLMPMCLAHLVSRLYYFNLYRRLKACGTNVLLGRGGAVCRPEELSLGSNIFIGRGFYISARGMRIGDNVLIGPAFLAECDDHIINRPGVTMFGVRSERNVTPITVEDDVWIGGRVTVLKGVTISEGCVVGAGSVVTASLPPYTICVGVPCRPRRTRFSEAEMRQHLRHVRSKHEAEAVFAAWSQAGLAYDSARSPLSSGLLRNSQT